jgi:lysozyme family protein
MFKTAYAITMKHEGGYSNHPNDRGGETFMGIARTYHPNWHGWSIIDTYAHKNEASADPRLNTLVEKFYYEKYYSSSRLNLDVIETLLPETSIELFDIAVNMGVRTAAKFLQRGVNLLNRDEKNYQNLKVDGFIGSKTVLVIDKYIKNDMLMKKLIILLKAKFYIDIAEKNETQEEFIRGWINRINL